jgi:DNA-binding CsgD family transcriptional regulator
MLDELSPGYVLKLASSAPAMLCGRGSECEALDRLLATVRRGESRALVLRGEPGIGKTALLEYAVERAGGFRVMRAAGVQSEMELAFAGVHQLCAPMLGRLERLPEPQRAALGTAFALSPGNAPDRFFVGLAVLSLLGEAAEEQPLLCVLDDAQWLDHASAQALAFVARRLGAESVAALFAVSEPSDELAGLPELTVGGLRDDDARALLGSVIRGPLDERVRERLVAETHGNPLALLELPRGLTPSQLAGGFGLPVALPLSGRIEESFRRRVVELPAETQRLLLVAAAEPIGEPVLLWRAGERLGIAAAAAAPAIAAGLLAVGARVRFRHPLVRSAVYRAASADERQAVHAALADATHPDIDPDRRAWHRAQATLGPDEDVAEELEHSAGRAEARGGLAAAAAFLERSAELTLDPVSGAERALAAAQAKHLAGAPGAALELLASAELGLLDELKRTRANLLRAQIAFAMNRGRDAPPLLLKAAKELERHDPGLARETYLEALNAALFAGRLAGRSELLHVAKAALAAPPPPHAPRALDRLLDGLAELVTHGPAAGTPILRQALRAFLTDDIPRPEAIRWLALAAHVAGLLWDDEAGDVLSARQVGLARDAGALGMLPLALSQRVGFQVHAGEFAAAASLIEEVESLAEATGNQFAPYIGLGLAAWRGREAEAAEMIEASIGDAARRGEGVGLSFVDWSNAVLYNGLGRYGDALAAGERGGEESPVQLFSAWALVELIEAATRTGAPDRARGAFERLVATTRASGSNWALGIEARSRAQLSDGDAAESHYREAIERLGRTCVRVDLARARLLYGEWLRRTNRVLDAREQLRAAHEMFTAIGMEAFGERARRELLATGETTHRRAIETGGPLTPQEAEIARLAREGLSNPEIGTLLFISRRTVEYHLHKVFAKLGISSRNQLHRALTGRVD